MSITIKHCLPGGEEFIYHVEPSANINFVPASAREEPSKFPYDSLWFDRASGGGQPRRYELIGGRAYVMNASGATVATYWLNDDRDSREGPQHIPPASTPQSVTMAADTSVLQT